jgi:hypothetical protein
MSTGINISPALAKRVIDLAKNPQQIKTFGDQLIDKTKDKIVATDLGKINTLKKQIEEITKTSIQAGTDHNTELKRLDVLLKEKQITQEQYDAAVQIENDSYNQKIKDLEEVKNKLTKDLNDEINDPLKNLKSNKILLKLKKSKRKKKSKEDRVKAKKELTKKVLKNAAKTLAPIIALELANRFAAILSQRTELEKLVDQVNAYIDKANTPETIIIATNLRNNAITLINNSIKKLSNIQKTIAQLDLYITIFTVIVSILSAIPIPTAVPPGIGIPVSLIMRIVKSLEKAAKLIVSLNVLTAIAITILENEISKLNELIERLKEITTLLNLQSASNLDEKQFSQLVDKFAGTKRNDDFGEYKGFKFKIKEEQTLGAQHAQVVKGNKRHYAVAINRDGTEVLKSDYSFTLDPNDLIEQLKLIIDQRNLQG